MSKAGISTALGGEGEKKDLFPLTNPLCQTFRGSETFAWCLHSTKKLQSRRAQAPACPPHSWDLGFCTTNTTVLLIHSFLSVHMSIEIQHKSVLFSSSTLPARRSNRMSLKWEEKHCFHLLFSTSQRWRAASMPPALRKERGEEKTENGQSGQHRQKTRPIAWRLSYHNSST